MQLIAINERKAELVGEEFSHGALTRAGHTHDDNWSEHHRMYLRLGRQMLRVPRSER
jgi:hypothetical protein